MIFLDTDIFVIDKLFPNDPRHKVNRDFLERTAEKATSIYNVLELCGIASFTLNIAELTKLFITFHRNTTYEFCTQRSFGNHPKI